ncbi:MAG: C4-dicarboxylate TRAP transporter large permease protein DctM [Alphaproteobacteria bacterium MarineAlpha5_Bin5]|nr:MAG: C4-dicarboxylate TRAP transporter large permease protein DctM [Alphaproteobacteria bacterium MarineAlpha5_Bin5]PPR52322.1 MAG: C4-dicarboxylate TRAP transporter large permease protein DctM [Alphaproteobacteria bacterium MarineAlpha5_Bin4]|tara:strand:+ start:1648 stop:4305 length:2658 start_codon:yes stop_codon:yes gene_type:complete
METVFLLILILTMIIALGSGFPVAFSLPGSAVLTILLAALAGYLFAGNASEYFHQDGPIQWLSAGITNFRAVYWEVERDTLIAIPLFIFMGIMLQRSKIAEDLLVTMGQLFGPIPGGLGTSVIFVGALLAATTGIVGATVVAMGLISLPAMLRNNYDKSLASGIVCSSGTLGQIIPPSIVLIILADQLASASDVANTARQAEYKLFTGEFSMPGAFSVSSTSAGDMFLGAFFPGLVLVGLYMIYVLVYARIKPSVAPPVPYDGNYDFGFAKKVFLSLVPPLTLIFIVLGSIILGIATVNQAGAIGAVGATIMGGYRLYEGKKHAYTPSIIAVLSIIAIYFLINNFDLRVKDITSNNDIIGITLAGVAVFALTFSVFWSFYRTLIIDETLKGVAIETCVTTSMVFIILVGAAMLTAAFRGFGGEELVTEFLTSLPGGFWTQFIVVMAVIFILGFFLDFIEIAVVVVPIIAPILLAQTDANVTAVWLGVMIGVNMQTSFLTPPFGFSLFYLRGVAPKTVSTIQIWRGAIAFIVLQLVGLGIVGYYPSLVNYLPYRTYLTSEVSPPPKNPRLQECLEEYKFEIYETKGDIIKDNINELSAINLNYLPKDNKKFLKETFTNAILTFELVKNIKVTQNDLNEYSKNYRSLHLSVRKIQKKIFKINNKIKKLEKEKKYLERENLSNKVNKIQFQIDELINQKDKLSNKIPSNWEVDHDQYNELSLKNKKAITQYRRNVDTVYENIQIIKLIIEDRNKLNNFENKIIILKELILKETKNEAMNKIKSIEKSLNVIAGADLIKEKLSKARRLLKKDDLEINKFNSLIDEANNIYLFEKDWRAKAEKDLLPKLIKFDSLIKDTIGLRLQEKLTNEQAIFVAACRSVHTDISLNF